MSYEVKLKVGQYWLDKESYFDVRLTDMGACISLCDQDSNTRYTALIDKGELILGEVSALISEEMMEQMMQVQPSVSSESENSAE
jgi:predicted RNA polymerase sigma factor